MRDGDEGMSGVGVGVGVGNGKGGALAVQICSGEVDVGAGRRFDSGSCVIWSDWEPHVDGVEKVHLVCSRAHVDGVE